MHGCLCQGTWRYFVGGEPLWSVIIWRILERCETIQFFIGVCASICVCESKRERKTKESVTTRETREKKLKTQGLIFCSIDVANIQLLLQLLIKKRNVTKLKHTYIYTWIQCDIFWPHMYFLSVFLTQTLLHVFPLPVWFLGNQVRWKWFICLKCFISYPILPAYPSVVLHLCAFPTPICTQMSIQRAVESLDSHWFWNNDRTSWGK